MRYACLITIATPLFNGFSRSFDMPLEEATQDVWKYKDYQSFKELASTSLPMQLRRASVLACHTKLAKPVGLDKRSM